MSPATRLAPEQRQAEILAATRAVLRETGYERLRTPDVAARAGVSEALVYRYFPTKDALLERACEAWFGELLEVEPEMDAIEGAEARLHHVVRHALGVVRAEPALSRYVLTVLRSRPGYRSTRLYELNRRFTGLTAQVISDAVAGGEFRDDVDVALLRDMIFGAVEHQTWAFLRDEGDFDAEASAAQITRVVVRGMSA